MRALIHDLSNFKLICRSYFTIPETVSQTLAYVNLTGFLNLLERASLTSIVDNLHQTTIFVPSNDAIAAARISSSTAAQLQFFVYSHIIPDFLGYLPQLRNFPTLTTLANTTVTVTIQNEAYIIGGAKIIDPDIITDNGVIHEMDKVSLYVFHSAV